MISGARALATRMPAWVIDENRSIQAGMHRGGLGLRHFR